MAAALREGHDRDRTKRIKWAAERAKKAGVEFERFDPFEIFERDGWRCYLCGEPTPPELRGTKNPRAPELEHLVPIAKGGLHTRENTACACRACNWKKGTGEAEKPNFLMPDWRSGAA
jgi:5-methylcytosine-specific restriction endonuclease McrA